jgi:hypothetical protein
VKSRGAPQGLKAKRTKTHARLEVKVSFQGTVVTGQSPMETNHATQDSIVN